MFIVDTAAYLPHHKFDISEKGFSEVDFLPLSPHKLLGGNESTGVLNCVSSFWGLKKFNSI